MNEIEFEKLRKAIKQKMNELTFLQESHIKETGICYIPGCPMRSGESALKTLKENIKD